jgi:putative chitinase
VKTAVNWRAAQRLIGAGVDGDPGRETYGRLFAASVGRKWTDPVFKSLGDAAAAHFGTYGITTVERISGSIAEAAHECGNFTAWEESLNFSAQGLANTWARYSASGKRGGRPNARALALARRPQDIANDTYGLRMGNVEGVDDNDSSPDGWQYRGRGMGLTGKAAYKEIGDAIGVDLLRYPDLAAEPGLALLIMLEFMKRKKMFAMMDRGDDEAERLAWNGGLLGFDKVQLIRKRVKKLLPAA